MGMGLCACAYPGGNVERSLWVFPSFGLAHMMVGSMVNICGSVRSLIYFTLIGTPFLTSKDGPGEFRT